MEIHGGNHIDKNNYESIVSQQGLNNLSEIQLQSSANRGDKPINCDECGRCFSHKRSLKKYQLTHSGDKLYKCNECKKQFVWSSELKRHMKTHTGQKPFSCDQCGKCFSRKGLLKTHQLTHSGEKLYECNECKKLFAHSLKFEASHKNTHRRKTLQL